MAKRNLENYQGKGGLVICQVLAFTVKGHGHEKGLTMLLSFLRKSGG